MTRNEKNPIYTVPLNNDRVQEVRLKIDEVTDVMRKNLEMAISRGEDLDRIEEKAEELRNHAISFGDNSRNLRRRECKRLVKLYGCIGIVLSVVITVIVLIVVYSKS